MKKIFSFFLALSVAFVAYAQTEIVFAGSGEVGSSDGSNSYKTDATNMFTAETAANVAAIAAVENVYPARTTDAGVNCGVKFGSSSKAGTLKLTLANPTEVEKIVVSAAMYSASEGTDGFTVNGMACPLSAGNKVFEDVTVTPEGVVTDIEIIQAKASSGRFYLNKITIYAKGGSTVEPTPTEPTTVTFDFVADTYGAGPAYTDSNTKYVSTDNVATNEGVTVTFTGDQAEAWRFWNDGIRAYYKKNPSFTVEAAGKVITNITWTVKSGATYALDGTTDNITEWKGAQESVKFNYTNTSSNLALITLTVTYTEAGDVPEKEDVIIYKKVAENLSTGLSQNQTRGGFVVDGDKVIVTDFTDGKLYQFAASDLAFLGQTEEVIQNNSCYMDIDDAGNYCFFEWTGGSATMDGAYVYNKATKEIKHYELPIEARADQPSCVGNLVTGKGAIFVYSNNLTYVNRYNFVDGEIVNIDKIEVGKAGGGINTVAALDVDHFFVQPRSLSNHYYVDATDLNNVVVETVVVKDLTAKINSSHGSEVFQLAGRTYMAVGNDRGGNYLGTFSIIDVTNPAEAFEVFAEDEKAGSAAMGTSAVEFRVVVEGNRAAIYEFACFNLRKYDMHIAEDGVITIEKKNVPDAALRLKNGEVKGNLRFTVSTNDAMESLELALTLNGEAVAAENYTYEEEELVVPYSFTQAGKYTYVIGAQGVDELGQDQKKELTYVLEVKEELVAMTIAEVIAAGDKAEVMLGDVYITYNPFNGKELFVADETGALEVFASKGDFDVKDKDLFYVGAVYTGLEGTMSLYNGVWELVPTTDANDWEYVDDVEVVPAAYTTKSVEFTNQLVAMSEVVVSIRQEGDYTNIYAKFADETEILVYDRWGIVTLIDNHKYNLEGVMTLFKNEPELYVTVAEDLGEVVEDGVENINGNAVATKVVRDGRVYIIRNGVEYTVLGAVAE